MLVISFHFSFRSNEPASTSRVRSYAFVVFELLNNYLSKGVRHCQRCCEVNAGTKTSFFNFRAHASFVDYLVPLSQRIRIWRRRSLERRTDDGVTRFATLNADAVVRLPDKRYRHQQQRLFCPFFCFVTTIRLSSSSTRWRSRCQAPLVHTAFNATFFVFVFGFRLSGKNDTNRNRFVCVRFDSANCKCCESGRNISVLHRRR